MQVEEAKCDNGVHDSTGGQPTVSPSVDFAAIALSCGYAGAALADDPGGFEQALTAALASPGPHLIHVRIRPGSIDGLGRPTLSPREVADRFKAFLAEADLKAVQSRRAELGGDGLVDLQAALESLS